MNRSAPPRDWKTQVQAFGQQLWTTYGQARWQGLSAHERLWLRVFLGLLGVWVFVSIAISPALRILNAAQRQRAEVAQHVVQMQALQQRAQELQKSKPLSRDESLRGLQSITPTSNPALQMTIQGDRVLVQLKNLPATQLATWLAQARSNSQALPNEVHITRSAAYVANTSTGVNATGTFAAATAAWDGQIILRLPQREASHANAFVNSNTSGVRP